jgi:type I restriction enzyme S subunit
VVVLSKKELEQTLVGKIPDDWEVVKLEEILHFKNGQRPKTSENGNFPVFGANGIMGYTNEVLVDNDFTIIVGRVGASGQVHLGKGRIWISDNAMYSANYEKEKAYLPYIFYLLKLKNLAQFASKTTHPIITQTFLNSFRIHLPPFLEQRKIAEVLGAVDSAISKVNEVIWKTERLKNGLMQTLLTKGIGHTEYKETPIGKIPKEWEVTNIDEECLVGTGGTPSRSNPQYFGGNVFWVKSTEVNYNIITKTEETLTESGMQNSNAKMHPKGSLIVALYGQGITRGKCAILGIDAAINQACAAIQSKGRIYIPYLFYWFQNSYTHIRRLSQGANQANLNMEIIRSLKIPLPSIPEQQKMVEILSTLDEKLELETKEKARLEKIKVGLMDLLLTGKIRVKVD